MSLIAEENLKFDWGPVKFFRFSSGFNALLRKPEEHYVPEPIFII